MAFKTKFVAAVLFWLFCLTNFLHAQGRVQLEIQAAEQAPVTAQQEWMQSLAAAGVSEFRISGGAPLAKVGIETQGGPADRVYVVTGAINASGDLLLPGARFRRSQAAGVARWLAELAEKGPPDKQEKKGALGLTFKQFQALHEALAGPVGFSTRGADRFEVARKIAGKLAVPVKADSGTLKAEGEDKLSDELSGLSCGTALACVLRPAGLCLVPRGGRGGPELAIVPAEKGLEIWPIGWPPKQPPPKVLPVLYESLDAKIQGVSLTTVLDAVAKRMKVPILVDHNALARHGVDPDKVTIAIPPGRTSHDTLLRRALSKSQLKYEVRVDEADNPLIWITTVKPL